MTRKPQEALDALDDIGNEMTLGYNRGLRLLRIGVRIMLANIVVSFLPGLSADVMFVVFFLIAMGFAAAGSLICNSTHRKYDRDMAAWEREYR